ncbi:MAG: dihydropteroate synthase [Dehalococcoidia bacterium]
MLLVGQSFEVWRDPLGSALARGDSAALVAQARSQLEGGAQVIDVNAGASGDASTLAAAASALRASMPDVPLWLDSGDPEAIVAALEAVPGPIVANAAALRGGAEPVIEAAARVGAGVVVTPRLADQAGTASIEELLILLGEGERLAAQHGIEGPLYLDALAFPPAHERGLALRSIALLRALASRRLERGSASMSVVAVGNVGHGAPPKVRPALRRVYAALVIGAGVDALITPVEDRALMRLLAVLEGREPTSTPGLAWLARLSRATRLGERLEPPPAEVGPALQHAWALLAGRA